MTYASPVWWTGKKNHAKLLTAVQNIALRHICAAFRTTPIYALEIDAAIPPITVTLDHASARYADRLHRLSQNHPVIQRLPEWHEDSNIRVTIPLPSYTKRKKQPVKKNTLDNLRRQTYNPREGERIQPFTTPPWRRTAESWNGRLKIVGMEGREKEKAAEEHNQRMAIIKETQSHLAVYSDGSQQKREGQLITGYGFAEYRNGKDSEVFLIEGGMGTTAEVYDAEMAGLSHGAAKAVQHAIENPNPTPIHHLIFFADNSSAITTIYDQKPVAACQGYAQRFRRSIETFLEADPRNTVKLRWCPGHKGIEGNKRADKLAKAGSERWAPTFYTYTNARRRSKAKALAKWRKLHAQRQPRGGFSQANGLIPRWKPRNHFNNTKREIYGRLIQCRTRHGFIGEYYAQFVPSKSVQCQCGHCFQTREHILQSCKTYNDHRHILWDASDDLNLEELLGTEEGIEAVAEFIKTSGAFSKTGRTRQDTKEPEPDEEPGEVDKEEEIDEEDGRIAAEASDEED
ncbi:hypothetical protein D9757_012170 [Collybiopsis confluens]|uniref:RNase H type-1 domain-containing protein n=1 Tax=Collybiopsis confluens TaxID=2823264 RepID=A0A8H5GK71_9AGAR|nr:hypothetical protein D9757_012170 [Collybiopsis confluens]